MFIIQFKTDKKSMGENSYKTMITIFTHCRVSHHKWEICGARYRKNISKEIKYSLLACAKIRFTLLIKMGFCYKSNFFFYLL